MPQPAAVVLAAGRGTRMRSELPKVLHPLAGKPMLAHVLDAVRQTDCGPIVVVVGWGAEQVRAAVAESALFAEQAEQLGTGHAVQQGLALLPADVAEVVVVYGECPLLQPETIRRLVERRREAGSALSFATTAVADPTGLGRIARDGAGRVRAIVEEAIASPAEKAIREVNGGAYCFQAAWLRQELSRLPLRPKGEYYLTDLVAAAIATGRPVETVAAGPEIVGINDRVQLAESAAALRQRICRALMLSGVTLVDPATTYVDAGVSVGPDTVIHPNTILAGRTSVGPGCELGPNSQIVDSVVGPGCRVWASVLESVTLEREVRVGPLSHLRPGTYLEAGADVGNFAELKSARVGAGTKVHHFGYLGDAELGPAVNVGAGTVTCNYDSETREKHRTVVEAGAALGSGTMLVAPVRVGAGAVTGAGAVVTRDVPPGEVVVGAPARPLRRVRR